MRQMQQNQTNYMTVNGIIIPYMTRGQGEPVVFVHGALADYRMWLPHYETMPADYQAIALTQRYFGESSLPTEPHEFGIGVHAHDLAAFIENLALGPVHLVAWSYGADVALNVAVHRPDLLKSLFIYEPGFPSYVENEQKLEQFGQDAQEMFGPVFAAVAGGNIREGVEKLMDGSAQKPGYFEAQSDLIRQQQLENAHTLPLQLSQLAPPILRKEDLRRTTLPVCVSWGEKTRPLFRIVTEAAAANLSNCERIIVTNVGHLFPLEEPAQFVVHLLNFLSKNKNFPG
ncbi:MAG: alpha/beta hydrolase [Anaerolineae bacterium]|nr:alpha/beta hydrolase [Anaerolineae bacterium]